MNEQAREVRLYDRLKEIQGLALDISKECPCGLENNGFHTLQCSTARAIAKVTALMASVAGQPSPLPSAPPQIDGWQPISEAKPSRTYWLYRNWPGKNTPITGTGFLYQNLRHEWGWNVRLSSDFQTTQEALDLLAQPTHFHKLPSIPHTEQP